MTTDTGHFTFERSLPVAPDQLWHLLTDGKMRESWGAPEEGMVLEMMTSDLRVGGIERHRCGPAEAPEFEVETRWYRLDGPTDAVFTETVEGGGESFFTSLITYRVRAEGGGSVLDVAVAVSSFTGPDAMAEVQAGWVGGLANLEALARNFAAA